MSPRRASGLLVVPDPENVAQTGAQGVSGSILGHGRVTSRLVAVGDVPLVVGGVHVDELPVCRGGCGKRILRRARWRNLPEEDQRELRALEVRRGEAQGVCGGCWPKKKAELIALPRENESIVKRVDVPGLWSDIREAGGGYSDLADKLGLSYEYARQVVVKLNLPRVDLRSQERTYLIEEVGFLVSCGRGLQEIASKFGFTVDHLIDRFKTYRERGQTTLFLGYEDNNEEWKVVA